MTEVGVGGKKGCHIIWFFLKAEEGMRDLTVTGVQTCALPILSDEILVIDHRNYETDGAMFGLYQELHEKASGRKTRPQETFDLMREWIGQVHGVLLLSRYLCHFMAAAYFLVYEGGAYYA